ncbi:hypothetical protein [Pelagibius marinus]|uniref:hypothetical protein n=1 Tax=Pelagibius marinus TaxID=2762760 RepID=UPI0018721FE9|nr:hypothetical protein [Pelagibius marinus]
MTGSLDRGELISLLETLGSDNDEEALAAARVLDTKVKVAGSTWDELLLANLGAEAAESGGAAYDLGDLGNLDELPADAAAKNAESLALIAKLLAKPDNSDEFRQELEDYKADIAAGEFTDSDHRYLRALCKRLSA